MSIEKKEFNYENYSEKTEQEKKDEIARNLEFSKEKKKLLERINKDKKLAYLKSLVERGLIKLSTAEHILIGEELNSDEIKEIFDKIDEIEEMQDIEKILPKQLRITKEEYIRALDDEDFRKEVLKKIDDSLSYLYRSSNPFPSGIMSFFSGLIHSLDHSKDKIILVQENIIDIKESLI